MLIDCETCEVRGGACDGCVVNALLQIQPAAGTLGEAEVEAIEVFARAGFEVTVLGEERQAPPRARTQRRRPGRRSVA